MILPPNELCRRIVLDLLQHDTKTGELTSFERQFCNSNIDRHHFTDKQKENVIVPLIRKYDLECTKGLPK
jgi:hypothetical protein